MPFDTWETIKAVFGIASIGAGTWLAFWSAKQRIKFSQLDQVTKESQKCNLNQRSIRKQKQASKQHSDSMQGRAVCIEKVTAHFMDNNYFYVNIKSGRNDDFASIECSPFWVVDKTFSKVEYEMYEVKVKGALASQQVLMPGQGFLDGSRKSDIFKKNLPSILTSASTLGIVGTLSLNSESEYVIEAKIIGKSLQQIEDFIKAELLWKGCYLVLGGAMVIVGIGLFIDMYRDYKKARVPLEASLLDF